MKREVKLSIILTTIIVLMFAGLIALGILFPIAFLTVLGIFSMGIGITTIYIVVSDFVKTSLEIEEARDRWNL